MDIWWDVWVKEELLTGVALLKWKKKGNLLFDHLMLTLAIGGWGRRLGFLLGNEWYLMIFDEIMNDKECARVDFLNEWINKKEEIYGDMSQSSMEYTVLA